MIPLFQRKTGNSERLLRLLKVTQPVASQDSTETPDLNHNHPITSGVLGQIGELQKRRNGAQLRARWLDSHVPPGTE